ncbi:hypothetical protein [Microcystis phage Mwe-JY26]
MTPVQIPFANVVLKAPPGSEEHCGDLPAFRSEAGTFTSFWQPSVEEIAEIVAGKPIALTIMSSTHPPVSVWVPGTEAANGG